MMTLLMMTLVLFGFRCLMGQDYLRQIEEQRYNRKQIDFTPQLKAADLNTSLKDHKFLGGEYNDIWGFKDSGNQYVIISKTLGFAVYKINTNGTADLIVNEASANNENNIWGEVRYYNGYIYKSTEADSIRIYALNLADSTVTYMKRFNGDAHNITLYQNFLFACGGAKTGVACYDISDPLNPVFKWLYNTHYVHDMTIQDDVLYVAEGSNFTFALYDISNVIGSSLTEDYLILRHNYPGAYTHNIWPTPDGKYVVTTDEDNVPYHLQFWDISDPENILNLLKHREGNSSIVHNAFIKNDFIYASYYTKGLVIFDISDKRLPVKIASYDAYLPRDDGAFFGTWGVYPFMDSNYVALSTIETGLDIVEFDQSIRAGQLTVSFFDTLDIAYNDPVIVTVSDPKYVKYYQQGNQIRLKGTPGSSYNLSFSVPSENFSESFSFDFPNNGNDSISFTLHETDTIPPIAPVLTSVAGGNASLSIQWQKNSETDVSMYYIYLDTLTNPTFLVDSVSFSSSSTIVIDLMHERSYFVRIRAKDTSGNISPYSNELSAITVDTMEPLAPVFTELVAGDGFVEFKWDLNPESDLESYKLYLDTVMNPIKLVATVDKEINFFSYDAVLNGKTYHGRIQAADTTGNLSDFSNELSVTPMLNIGKKLTAKISVFQSPVFADALNLLISTNLDLSAQPFVSINTTLLDITEIDKTHYSTAIKLHDITSVNLSIHMEAFGTSADTTRSFFAQTVNKSNPVFVSENNHLRLTIDQADLQKPIILATASTELGVSEFITDHNFSKTAKLELRYSDDVSELGKLFIYAYKDKQWQRLNSQVFSNTQRVVAYVNELTSYKLAVDPNFTGSNLVPEQYNLLQNYPNPFNPSTTIQYDLASDAIVRIVIYNMLGQKVRTLLNQFELAGSAKKIVWDGKNDAGQRVVSGIYIYQLNTATFSQSKKMVLIK